MELKKLWVSPELEIFGDVKELTQKTVVVTKTGNVGDTITINGQSIAVPGSKVVPNA